MGIDHEAITISSDIMNTWRMIVGFSIAQLLICLRPSGRALQEAHTHHDRDLHARLAPIEPRGKPYSHGAAETGGIGRAVQDDRARERWDSRRSSVDVDPTVIALKRESQRHGDTDDS